MVEAVRVELEEEERKGRVERRFHVFEPKSRGMRRGGVSLGNLRNRLPGLPISWKEEVKDF